MKFSVEVTDKDGENVGFTVCALGALLFLAFGVSQCTKLNVPPPNIILPPPVTKAAP